MAGSSLGGFHGLDKGVLESITQLRNIRSAFWWHSPDRCRRSGSFPEQTARRIRFVVNSKANLECPYRYVGETFDEKPTSGCTVSSGKIIYAGMRMVSDQIDFFVTELVGQWTWQ